MMKKKKDYYKILEVDENADPDTIKKAYRSKAMKHHPDRNKGDKKSEEIFKEISEAYEVLSDSDKKAKYDRGDEFDIRFNPFDIYSQVFNMTFNDSMFGDPFADLRGFRRAKSRQRSSFGIDNKIVFRASIEDIIKGRKIEVNFDRKIACEKCYGAGSKETNGKCKKCNGRGQVQSGNSQMVLIMTCNECGGSGIAVEECKDCNGQGFQNTTEKAIVNIPPGINSMSALKMEQKGNVVYFNGKKYTGSTYIIIDHPQQDKGITLRNGDIYTSIRVPFNTIMCEKEIKVNILGCKEINFKLDSNKKSGYQYKVESQGTTDQKDAFIKVLIDFPKNKIDEKNKSKVISILEEVYGLPTVQFSPETTTNES